MILYQSDSYLAYTRLSFKLVEHEALIRYLGMPYSLNTLGLFYVELAALKLDFTA